MQCLRCGNTEKRYFYKDAKGWYCRKCIMFGRIGVGELPERKNVCRKPIHTAYQLKYPLTPAQKRCASEIVMYLNHHQDVLVYAACGAGKTELVMEAIKQSLAKGCKIGRASCRERV